VHRQGERSLIGGVNHGSEHSGADLMARRPRTAARGLGYERAMREQDRKTTLSKSATTTSFRLRRKSRSWVSRRPAEAIVAVNDLAAGGCHVGRTRTTGLRLRPAAVTATDNTASARSRP